MHTIIIIVAAQSKARIVITVVELFPEPSEVHPVHSVTRHGRDIDSKDRSVVSVDWQQDDNYIEDSYVVGLDLTVNNSNGYMGVLQASDIQYQVMQRNAKFEYLSVFAS